MKKLLLIFLLMIPVMSSSKVMLPADDPLQSRGLSILSITDIEATGQAVWIGAGNGVSYLNFGDSIWNAYDSSNGLMRGGISALYAIGDTIYLASAIDSTGELDYYSFGIMRTLDNGLSWDTLSFNSVSQDLTDTIFADSILMHNTAGWERIVFDIAGKDSILFAVSKVSGLIGSFNNGDSWRPIYLHYLDSIYYIDPDTALPSFSQRYFSVAVDSTHTDSFDDITDSLIVWAGTPVGLRRFTYAPEYSKIASNLILDITSDGDLTYFSGDSGLTTMKFDTVYYNDAAWIYIPSYRSYRKDSDNLPGTSVTTAYKYGDKLFVGTIADVTRDVDSNIVYGAGTGIAVMADNEASFSSVFVGLDSLAGTNRYAKQFSSIDDNLFIAGYDAGLFVSSDSGLNWDRLCPDTADTSYENLRNKVHSLIADSTNLFVGTDSGIVLIRFDDVGNDTLHEYIVFEDSDSTGSRVYNMGIQRFFNTVTETLVDSTFIWAIQHPVETTVGEYGVYYSKDYGSNWIKTTPYRSDPVPFYDIDFKDNHAVLAGKGHLSVDAGIFWLKDRDEDIWENINDQRYSLEGLELFAVLSVDDTIYVGSEHGFAELTLDDSYNVFDPHLFYATTDPQQHVGVSNYVYPDLTGNFVNVLEIQNLPSGQSRIWASTRPGYDPVVDEYIGVTSATVDGRNWERYDDMEAWGFAFNGDTVFAATEQGLLMKLPNEIEFDTIQIIGTMASSLPHYESSIDSLEEIYSLEVIRDTLWVGTDNGLARIDLSDIGFESWDIYRIAELNMADGVYAYPVPFSHAGNDKIFFHYELGNSTETVADDTASVTIEVYDFAMDLVKTVTKNEHRVAVMPEMDYWDGRNGKGDKVAIGVYYFKLTLSTGVEHWDKIIVLP